MKLIKVETKGFKSFAEKVTLTFDGGVVGIVGPNGSGKSNINDAIKWVLGERSIKSLRGSSSDDIIFSGSKTAPRSEKAEVSLTFDNSDHKVSIPHKEFTITRMIKRGSGENEYFINGEVAKLKDIEEIAMESGISKSSLAIISQGTIQNIAQATPEDRRYIFEEAAGVSKYKSKKDEALRKLERTTDALNQVKTVTSELEKQLAPLKRQADKAKVYLEKKSELKSVEIGLLVEDMIFFNQKLEELNGQLENVLKIKEDLTSNINQSEKELSHKSEQKLRFENEVLSLTSRLQDVSDKLRDLDVFNSQQNARRKMIISGEIAATNASKLEAMKEELEEISKKNNQYRVWDEKITSDIAGKKVNISSEQTKLTIVNSELESLKRNLLQVKTKISILKDHEENKTHLFKGTKIIMDNQKLFPGVLGMVADVVKVEDKFISAIETILSNSLQHIVVDRSETGVKAANFLKNNNGGRATFIPLNTIKPKGVIDEHLNVLRGQNGFIGLASDLVKMEPKFEILKKFLLGNIIVATSLDAAENISRFIRSQYMVVSLDGDIIRAGGVITGGEKAKSKDILGASDQIQKLEQLIPSFESQISTQQIEASKLSNIISEEQLIISELNIEAAKIREKKYLAESHFNSLKIQFEASSNEKFQASDETISLESSQLLESEKLSLQTSLKAKRESLISLNHDVAKLTLEKTEFEKSLRNLIESSSQKMTEKNQADYVVKTSSVRLAEEYELTLETAQASHTLNIPVDEAREIVSNLRQEIRDLGNVNIDSIDQFNEVNERFASLKSSEEELFNAQQTIIGAIGEMDQIIISRLDETVKLVNQEMTIIFQKLFGGGHAEVRYTNPTNLLETGIDVIAQPPGKIIKNLNLFSGGEKAMVAISLLFAILKSKPLPLCILDEVEAALDDANVIRFAEYLQELKAQTQFMVITHRVGTMSRVDHLFGATMQTRGITSFFTVKLSDAKKLIEE